MHGMGRACCLYLFSLRSFSFLPALSFHSLPQCKIIFLPLQDPFGYTSKSFYHELNAEILDFLLLHHHESLMLNIKCNQTEDSSTWHPQFDCIINSFEFRTLYAII